MERQDILKKITDIATKCGMLPLSKKCGNYYTLMDNPDGSPLVNKFAGKYGYKTVSLNRLPTKTLELIYSDIA